MEEFYANGILPTFNVNSQEHLEKISSFNKYNSICIKKHFILEKEDTIFLSEYKAYHNFFFKYPVIKAILYIDSEEQKVIHNSKDFSFYSFPMPVYSIKGIVSVKIFSETNNELWLECLWLHDRIIREKPLIKSEEILKLEKEYNVIFSTIISVKYKKDFFALPEKRSVIKKGVVSYAVPYNNSNEIWVWQYLPNHYAFYRKPDIVPIVSREIPENINELPICGKRFTMII